VSAEQSTRDRIRAEAAALFRAKGFNGTSMADLAAEVGITKSSLYHHFPSKQSLLAEIVELTVNRATPLVRTVAESDLPPAERLGQAVVIHTVEAIRDLDSLACYSEEGRYLSSEFKAAHVEKRDRYEHFFREIYDEGIASGAFVEQDAGIAVKAVIGMCNSVVRWYRADGSYTPEGIALEFARFAVRGATGRLSAPLTTGVPW
jgi:AcrR family transcriptional regulator